MSPKKKLKRKKPASKIAATGLVKKKKSPRPRTAKQFFALPDAQQEIWNRVVHVIAKMRAEGTSLTRASREYELDPRVVRTRAGSALRKKKSGRYIALPSDKLLRVLVIPSPQGLQEIAVRGSQEVSLLAEYWNAVHHHVQTGDTSRLKKFRGQQITDADGKEHPFLTDPRVLNRLGSAGDLKFESVYARAA